MSTKAKLEEMVEFDSEMDVSGRITVPGYVRQELNVKGKACKVHVEFYVEKVYSTRNGCLPEEKEQEEEEQ